MIMNNTRKNRIVITANSKHSDKFSHFKLVRLLFFSSLIALSPLSVSATEQKNKASKIDSGYYEGNYGKGVYWTTPGVYSSIFNPHGEKTTDKPKKYFIYNRRHLSEARPHQMHHDAAPVENKHINPELLLPGKSI